MLTDARFHRGRITGEDKAAFFKSGVTDVEFVLQHIQPSARERALDFGCGLAAYP